MVWKEIILLMIGAIVGGAIVYLREYFILKHEYKLEMVNSRIEDFIDDSKKYFGPIALASGDLSKILKARKNEILKQKEIPFYWLATYLYQRDLLRGNTYFYFPSEAQEEEVVYKFGSLNAIIAEMFEYNKRYIANIASYYKSHKEYNAFCDKLSEVRDEFEIFKNKINDEVFKNKLCERSEDFSNSVIDAINTAYEPWYEQHDKYK
ncbi:MAG: hypothetical protein KAW47_01080 [Thermoplasmatales archaeon]|nr:hypothetical protein [Thermoplasmatales archaeon]